jgi:hypothetical protein
MPFYVSRAIVANWAAEAGVAPADATRLIGEVDRFVAMVETEGRLRGATSAQQAIADALGVTLSDFYTVEKLAIATGRVVKVDNLPPPVVPPVVIP